MLVAVAYAAPPDAPTPLSPADGAADVALEPALAVAATDPDGDPLTVTLQGRVRSAPGGDFTIVALPDTQYYTCGCSGGSTDTYGAQTAWIAENAAELNVVFVTHLGDCVEDGDLYPDEWTVADEAMSVVEEAGLPYGVAVGNHDQTPLGDPNGTTDGFNATFGAERFAAADWYVGHYGEDNDNHAELFEGGGVGWLIVHLEYDNDADPAVLAWADDVLSTYATRRAIVVTHHMVDTLGSFSPQGQAIYDSLSAHENLVLLLGGHVPGEGQRTDTLAGRTVHALLADYQARDNGGDGWLRLLRFSPAAGTMTVETYSVTQDAYEDDTDSSFTVEIRLDGLDWETVGTGTEATWSGRSPLTTYEWRAVVDDGDTVTTGPTWSFTTMEAHDSAEPVDSATVDSTAGSAGPARETGAVAIGGTGCSCGAAVPWAGPWVWLAGALARRRASRVWTTAAGCRTRRSPGGCRAAADPHARA